MFAQVGRNKLKTGVIFLVTSVFVALVVYFIAVLTDMGVFAIPLAVGITTVSSFLSYYFSDRIILSVSGARPADPNTERKVINAMEGLVIAAGMPMPKVYVMNDPSPNAFATGRNPRNAVVCVTTGLLETMDYYQLEGVLAHELAHIRNYDILVSTVVTVMVGTVVILADLWRRSLFFGGGRGKKSGNKNEGPVQLILLAVGIVLIILAPIAGQLMKMALSRNREYLADATAVELTRNPEGLATALEELRAAPPVAKATNATAALFISNPLKKKPGEDEKTNWFSTHPPIKKRVSAIRNIK